MSSNNKKKNDNKRKKESKKGHQTQNTKRVKRAAATKVMNWGAATEPAL